MNALGDSTSGSGKSSTAYHLIGYYMIRSAVIREFRAFELVKLSGLRRINVIAGKNASGKTALLEAISLVLSANPDIAIRFRLWRSSPLVNTTVMNADVDRQLWSDLFRDFDLSKTIRINLEGDQQHSRSLTIRYDEKNGWGTPIQISGAPAPLSASPIVFEYRRPSKKPWRVRAIPMGIAYHYQGAEAQPPEGAFFAANYALEPVESVQRFTNLSIARKSDAIVQEIQKEFPFIRGIEAGTRAGTPALFLDVEGAHEKVPIGFVSGGVQKIVAILLAIASMPRGVIVIDEIENGIFHDRLEPMWGAIYRFALTNDVQIFASTHSAECLNALDRASEAFRKDLSFIRIERENGGKIIEQLTGADMFKVSKIGDIR